MAALSPRPMRAAVLPALRAWLLAGQWRRQTTVYTAVLVRVPAPACGDNRTKCSTNHPHAHAWCRAVVPDCSVIYKLRLAKPFCHVECGRSGGLIMKQRRGEERLHWPMHSAIPNYLTALWFLFDVPTNWMNEISCAMRNGIFDEALWQTGLWWPTDWSTHNQRRVCNRTLDNYAPTQSQSSILWSNDTISVKYNNACHIYAWDASHWCVSFLASLSYQRNSFSHVNYNALILISKHKLF